MLDLVEAILALLFVMFCLVVGLLFRALPYIIIGYLAYLIFA